MAAGTPLEFISGQEQLLQTPHFYVKRIKEEKNHQKGTDINMYW